MVAELYRLRAYLCGSPATSLSLLGLVVAMAVVATEPMVAQAAGEALPHLVRSGLTVDMVAGEASEILPQTGLAQEGEPHPARAMVKARPAVMAVMTVMAVKVAMRTVGRVEREALPAQIPHTPGAVEVVAELARMERVVSVVTDLFTTRRVAQWAVTVPQIRGLVAAAVAVRVGTTTKVDVEGTVVPGSCWLSGWRVDYAICRDR